MLRFNPRCLKLKSLTTCRSLSIRSFASFSNLSILDLVKVIPNELNDRVLYNSLLENKMPVCKVEVLGSGAEGVPACVLIRRSPGIYLINAGEGTQRLANEYKVRIPKQLNVFVTYPSWRNISGLLGLMLTLRDSYFGQKTRINIHGDYSIRSIFSVVNKFASLRSLEANVMNCSHDTEYKDEYVTVKYVCLHPSSSETSDSSCSQNPDFVVSEKEKNTKSECGTELKRTGSVSHSSTSENEENVHSEKNNKKVNRMKRKNEIKKPSICYIFTTPATKGKLNFEACVDLGVPPGPLLGELKSGKDVTLENGKIVRSEEVTEPDQPGVNIIALECPTEEYLDSLLAESLICQYQLEDTAADVVIHFSSSQIVNNLKYQNWIKRFPQKTKHLFINEENKRTGSVAIHRLQYKLNLLDPVLFPLLHDAGIPDFPRCDNSVTDDGHALVETVKDADFHKMYRDTMYYKCETNNFIKGETLCMLHVKPKLSYDYSKCLTLRKDAFLEEVYQEDVGEKIDKCREELQEISSKLDSDKRIYPKIVFLGTGSAKASKVRNASGILIFVAEDKSIIFDCGESTFNQLISFYGRKKTREILRTVKAIFISHLHVDHHFGLITILKERKRAFDELNESASEESNKVQFEPAIVFAPVQLLRWLQLFTDMFENISDLYDMIGNGHVNHPPESVKDFVESVRKRLNLKNISTVPVHHAPFSFGVSLVHESGWKLTYSGDTRPCEDLIRLGMDSDILIHEATFENLYQTDAVKKLHSTTYEAINVGKRMNAKYILLTHFSQRYCYIPSIEEEFSQLNIGVAFDFMEVPFNRLPILPLLLNPLTLVFSKYDEKVKSKAKTKEIKREREKNKKNRSSERDHSPVEDERPAKISKKAFQDEVKMSL